MTAESPLNAVEPAEESTVGPVNPASWQTSTLVRDEIAEGASHAAGGVTAQDRRFGTSVMSNLAGKIAYKPVGLILGATAGAISGLVFKQIWKRARER